MTIDYSLLSKKTQKRGMQVIKPSLSTYDADYNRKGGKISSYYKKGGNVITGR